ncbi:hypothetical protein M501DRAFT_1032505 [Patellaria atrata CBS 101060]|uniref:F-box domain-containing protein n=1 Tax=Patellaria atrata CBS 101060 TaxID=1346257 RepID=A0A9P4S9Q8_9PEZI|nr:hypothetical protein M501DRAFT_1032505 [Patellaria atrata CBS 101060]
MSKLAGIDEDAESITLTSLFGSPTPDTQPSESPLSVYAPTKCTTPLTPVKDLEASNSAVTGTYQLISPPASPPANLFVNTGNKPGPTLLTLPGEIRNEIYKFVFSPADRPTSESFHTHSSAQLAPLLTCRQIAAEAGALAWHRVWFVLPAIDGPTPRFQLAMTRFLDHPGMLKDEAKYLVLTDSAGLSRDRGLMRFNEVHTTRARVHRWVMLIKRYNSHRSGFSRRGPRGYGAAAPWSGLFTSTRDELLKEDNEDVKKGEIVLGVKLERVGRWLGPPVRTTVTEDVLSTDWM